MSAVTETAAGAARVTMVAAETSAISQYELNKKTMTDGERIASLERDMEGVPNDIQRACDAVRAEVKGHVGRLTQRLDTNDKKTDKIDDLKTSIDTMTARFAGMETAAQQTTQSVAALTTSTQATLRAIQDKLIHLERDDQDTRRELEHLKSEVRDMRESRKGVHSQLWGIICSIAAGVGTALIMMQFNGGIG